MVMLFSSTVIRGYCVVVYWGLSAGLIFSGDLVSQVSHISRLFFDLAHRNTLLVGLPTPIYFNPIREAKIKLRGFEG